MNKEKKVLIVIFCIFSFIISLLIGIPYYMSLDDENFIIESKIVDIEILEFESIYNRPKVKLILENGSSYIVVLPYVIGDVGLYDFTKNSSVKIHLFRPDKNSVWELKEIYKTN